MKKPYSSAVRAEAITLYLAGFSTYEVARELGCTRPTICNWLKKASIKPRGKLPQEDVLGRFWSKVDMSGDCWEWCAGLDKDGYAKFWLNGATLRASRFIYEWAHGETPGEKHVCHSCDNPRCVKPEHLWLGTAQENNLDCVRKGRHTKAWPFLNLVGGQE